ncbi:methyltransferase domain-containing protein [Flagellimonas olearia]|uniref:Methyltransferase domain-containing protein n=1 Tax=Flagellimonas olearia TaxID=552546 RepID=A0A6I1EC55_9FLAO|nr:class I SAM-dependent methyltransferase [Allomuricauda olearia]KAB7531344.1 methyltransferase domain-containing protein [Allomuricauda olearia]
MEDPWLKRWDERYSNTAYAFGEKPNEYLREQLQKLEPGNILFAAEGEGRNAVYAAKLGWTVSAFDISTEGRKKALQLAEKNKVSLNYEVGQLPDLAYTEGQFDAIALIYAHFPASIKSAYHKLLSSYLRKGGTVIFEAFGKKHLPYREKNPKVGGPRDLESLFSIEELLEDFTDYEITELVEKEVELNEGLYHSGTGSVVRFVGRKK